MTALLVGLAVLALAAAGLALFTYEIARRVRRGLPPRGRFVEVGGQRIHYVDRGRGPAIVMVHGLSGQLGNFAHSLAGRLTSEFRVVLIDRPGSGWSTRAPGAPAGLKAQAETIVAVIRALGLERPLLVGHSLGGAVALAVGLDHPEVVRGLALIAPLTHPQDEIPEPFRLLAVRSPAISRLVAWTLATPLAMLRRRVILDYVFGPDTPPPDFGTRGGALLGLRPESFRNASRDMFAAHAEIGAMVARYPGLTIPVAILYGTGDRILDHRRHGEAMRERVAGLALELIEGGHMLPITAPDAAAAFVRSRARQERIAAE